MRVRLTTPVIGAWTGKVGDEVDRPDAEALKLIRAGVAVLIKDTAAKLETATLKETLETTKAE